MKRKKILWLCSWYPSRSEPFNGDFIQRHARAAALFNDIYVIHVYGELNEKNIKSEDEIHKNPGLTEHIIYYAKTRSLIGKISSSLKYVSILKDAIRQYINDFDKPDLVHVHIPYKAGIGGLWIKKKYGVPYIVTEHWGIYNKIAEGNYLSRSPFFKRLVKKVFTKASKFLSVSNFLGSGVNQYVLKKEFEVISNVVDTDLFFFAKKESGVFRFIHVSNMVPLKNAEGILKAFKLFLSGGNNAELVMVGDTGVSIRESAMNLNFPDGAVSFRGEVLYASVAEQMQKSDCLVLFSNIENSPCVIGEALCSGLPVIATHVGGIPELLNHENSILIQPGDETALCSAMKKMLDKYQAFNRNEIAENAKKKFSYTVIGKKMADTYEAILEKIDKRKF
ncbi:MAG TPA: glycosyltransferase [Chitinophagaceae bacterium]|nr:glycosyltransferase [Chitinophagaceae bacterium]